LICDHLLWPDMEPPAHAEARAKRARCEGEFYQMAPVGPLAIGPEALTDGR
jgi:hypothetical protein